MFPNKYIVYAGLIILSIAILSTYMVVHDNAVKQQALLQFNNTQLLKVIENQNDYMKKIKEIDIAQKEIINSVNQKNDSLDTKLKDIETYLNSDEANKDSNPSSKVLKNTIKELSRTK